MRAQRGTDGTILNAAVLTAEDVTRQRVLCPACMLEVFESWPEGWDAHAAHGCEGVNPAPPDQRKAEFRGALGHLFPVGERKNSDPLSLDAFVTFVRTLEGRVLRTAQEKSFTVKVEEKGFIYTPESTGRPRVHRYPRLQIYLDEFSRSRSLDWGAYHGGSNQSYVLALLRLFEGEPARSSST